MIITNGFTFRNTRNVQVPPGERSEPGRAVEASVGRTDFLRAQKSVRPTLASTARPGWHISGVTKCEAIGNGHEMAP